MRPPYVLDRQYTQSGTLSTPWQGTMTFLGGPLSGQYIVKRYTVTKSVPLGNWVGTPNVYCRGINAPTGWSAANPNYGTGFCEVASSTATSATLRTYLYEVWTLSGQYRGWYPTTAQNVQIHYTVNGIPSTYAPLSVSLSGPDMLGPQETGTWTAQPSGGPSSSYTYAWSVFTNGQWTSTGVTTPSYSRTMGTQDFDVRVDVASGAATGSASMHVMYQPNCTPTVACGRQTTSGPTVGASDVPAAFALHAPVPNPARDRATLRIDMPEPAHVSVRLYDVLGREVAMLLDDALSGGRHTVAVPLGHLPTGVYVYRVATRVQGQPVQRSGTLSVLR